MKPLAMSCGTAIYQDGQTVYVLHVGGNALAVARFVTALIALLALLVGVLLATTQSIAAGAVGLGGACLAACLFVVFGKIRAQRLARSPLTLPRYVTIDLSTQEVRDYQGQLLGPLAAARLKFVFQATSSSKAVALSLPGTQIVIARGNPFAGDTGLLIDALVRLGVRSPY